MLRQLAFNVVEIINGIIGILSFGFIQLDLSYKLALFLGKRDCEKMSKQYEERN